MCYSVDNRMSYKYNNMKNIILEMNRLLLRKFSENDLDDYFEYAQMEEIGYYCCWEAIKKKIKLLKD